MFCTNYVAFGLLDEIHEKVCMQIETPGNYTSSKPNGIQFVQNILRNSAHSVQVHFSMSSHVCWL